MPPLSVMLKPASGRCNMRCKYCFYYSLASSREIADYGIMKYDTAKRVIDSALAFADGERIYFSFQGGEPLIAGKEFFLKFFDYVREKNVMKSEIYYALQTNGTLIDDEWIDIFKANSVLVGLSLDGDKEENRYRLDANYAPVVNKVTAAADAMKERGVDFNVLTVVTGRTAENIERVYKHFRARGYKYLQFIPCLRPFGDKSESELYMSVPQYAKYLVVLFNMYVKDYADGNYISIRHFDNMVRLFLGQKCEQCGAEGHCSHQFVVEGNGNVYPCDFYCVDDWLLGNIECNDFFELANSDKAKRFILESLPIDEKCKNCRYYRVCRGGGCKRHKADRDYCEAYKTFFSMCLPLFNIFAKEKPNK